MTSKREAILAHVTTLLSSVTGLAAAPYRSRVEAFARNESPAIVVEPGTDSATPVTIEHINWELRLLVAVHVRGTPADQLADPIIQQVHSLLMADRSLGGRALDVWPLDVDPQVDPGDQSSGWFVCSYRVRYRTMASDLTM